MPVHLLWGMTQDKDETTEDVSAYKPETKTVHPVPEVNTVELVPTVVPDDEDPCT